MVGSYKIFVDTGGFIALMFEKDQLDNELKYFLRILEKGAVLVTSDYVLDEFFTYARCCKKIPIPILMAFVKSLENSEIDVVAPSKKLFRESLFLMQKYQDHYFSFTDCVSFKIMEELKIKDVLTTDSHFAIFGFNNLLRNLNK